MMVKFMSPYDIDQGATACRGRTRGSGVDSLVLPRMNEVHARFIPRTE